MTQMLTDHTQKFRASDLYGPDELLLRKLKRAREARAAEEMDEDEDEDVDVRRDARGGVQHEKLAVGRRRIKDDIDDDG